MNDLWNSIISNKAIIYMVIIIVSVIAFKVIDSIADLSVGASDNDDKK